MFQLDLIAVQCPLSDNLGEDCPVFENLFEFCQLYAGGTIVFICQQQQYLTVYTLIRVMTVSFHKYGDMFFPGTGDVKVILLSCLRC
ncbi:hypothetical protein BHM03_00002054 [Ensete ventricosum]|nr:hypothetical protein BHM03_00002054 [Ensete ventricosum]